MDVHGAVDAENRDIIVWKKHSGRNQQWDVVYTDQWKGEPTKGQLNPEYGMYVERDFYIQSQLRARRYLDILGRNIVIKTPNGRRTQIWYFHQQSLTIKSRNNN
jgi:hypothetical protein